MASASLTDRFDIGSTLDRQPTLMTVDELAKLVRMNRNTVYEAAARSEIPGVVYIGRTIRFVRDVVVEWMCSQGCVPRSPRSDS